MMTHEEQTKERSLPSSMSVTAGDGDPSKTVKATPNEWKGRATGFSSVIALLILSTASLICGIYSFSNCDFLTRNVTLSGDYSSGGYTAACNHLSYDLQGEANDFQQEVCNSVMRPHGIGFVNWQSTVDGTDQEACFSYEQQMPWGKDRPVFDNAFGASRVFSIVGIVFGAFAWCTLTCNMYIDQQRLKGMTCYYLVAAFFHGISLLVFLSDVCEAGFFQNYLVPPSQRESADGGPFDRVTDDVTVTCSRSTGANAAIGAVVLYTLCDVVASCLVIPFYEEQCYRASYRAAEQRLGREKEQQDATSPPTKASPPPGPGSIQHKSIQHKSSGRKPHLTSDERFFGNSV